MSRCTSFSCYHEAGAVESLLDTKTDTVLMKVQCDLVIGHTLSSGTWVGLSLNIACFVCLHHGRSGTMLCCSSCGSLFFVRRHRHCSKLATFD